jgi:hypothetical protein
MESFFRIRSSLNHQEAVDLLLDYSKLTIWYAGPPLPYIRRRKKEKDTDPPDPQTLQMLVN